MKRVARVLAMVAVAGALTFSAKAAMASQEVFVYQLTVSGLSATPIALVFGTPGGTGTTVSAATTECNNGRNAVLNMLAAKGFATSAYLVSACTQMN